MLFLTPDNEFAGTEQTIDENLLMQNKL